VACAWISREQKTGFSSSLTYTLLTDNPAFSFLRREDVKYGSIMKCPISKKSSQANDQFNDLNVQVLVPERRPTSPHNLEELLPDHFPSLEPWQGKTFTFGEMMHLII